MTFRAWNAIPPARPNPLLTYVCKIVRNLSQNVYYRNFLDTLTVENRVIFMRRYWFSDSCKDIARFAGLTEKNISVRLTRIRQKMKRYLAEREIFL